MLRDETQLLDFLKMSLFMNGSSSKNTLENLFYILLISCLPYFIDYIKQMNIVWNLFQLHPKYTLLIEGKRSLRASHWCFKYNNMFSQEFRALWYLINKKCKFEGINSLKSIMDDEIEYNDDDEVSTKKHNKSTIYIVNQDTYFLLEDDIYCRIFSKDNSEQSDKVIEMQGPIETISIELFSHKKTANELKNFVEKNTEHYLNELEKQRDGKKFIYSLENDSQGEDETKKWRENEFISYRTFDNMFFPEKENLLKQLLHFRDNKDEYIKHGDPYTLGICLYGPPGTGKTCIAKSIANMFQRHLVELPMDNIQTKSEFKKYFFEAQYNNKNKSNTIGFDKKIILLEDIDCMSEIVYEREEKYAKEEVIDNSGANVEIFEKFVEAVSKNDNKTSSNNVMNSSSKYFSKKNNDELTLSFILNVLDGVQETPGRIMIMTSNYIQKIDKALIRPGRFDICLELGYVIMDTVKDFYYFHYKKTISKAMANTLNIEKLTPAELVSIRRCSHDAKQFIQQLQQRTPRVST